MGSPDGRWIGYWADGKLQKVSVNGGRPWCFVTSDLLLTEPELRAGTPRPIRDVFYSDYIGRNYDVTPDGKRFVMVCGGPSSQAETIHVVVNWFEVLKERVPVE